MEQSLDNILNGTSTDEQVPEVVETPAEAAPAEAAPEPSEPKADALGRLHGEDGKFLPKSEQPAEAAPAVDAAPGATPAPSEEPQTVPVAAQIDERRKRQAAEARADELQRQLAQYMSAPPPQFQPQPIPDQWDDPEGHTQYLVSEAVKEAKAEAIAEIRRQRVMDSAEAAKVKYPDYTEKVPVFEALAQENPALWQSMLQHPNPAEYAYSIAKDHEEMGKYGSLEARDAAKKKEWEAAALEALKANLAPQSAPPTLSNERNVGQRSGPEWSGPQPLADILRQ